MILGLLRTIWQDRVAANSSLFRETPDMVANDIARGGGVVLTCAGEPIGAGRFVLVPGPAGDPASWMEAKRIGVSPRFQGQGLGLRILAALEAGGAARGAQGCQLAVRADQPALVGYYLKAGYVEAHDVVLSNPNPQTPTPVFMRKRFGGVA